jgi:hypothetical protein
MQNRHIEFIDIGNTVLCDLCNADYTDSEEKGGLVVDASAVCPECQPGMEKSIKKYGEDSHVDARCPEGVEFRAFILKYRDGADYIAIETWEN